MQPRAGPQTDAPHRAGLACRWGEGGFGRMSVQGGLSTHPERDLRHRSEFGFVCRGIKAGEQKKALKWGNEANMYRGMNHLT